MLLKKKIRLDNGLCFKRKWGRRKGWMMTLRPYPEKLGFCDS